MTTSFQKKSRSLVNKIPGTKVARHETLTSTGVTSFDQCIGGGLAVGSVLLVEENDRGFYSKLLTKYFIAEGLAFGHKVVVCTNVTPANSLLKDIPTAAKKSNTTPADSCKEPLKIAWRYQQLPSTTASPQTCSFDWGQPIGTEQLKSIAVYDDILTYSGALQYIVNAIKLQKAAASSSQLLRVVVEGLGSPLWEDEDNAAHFLYCLRALARDSSCVIFISSPGYWLQQDPGRRKEMRRLTDVVIRLEVFQKKSQENHSHYKKYNGFVHFHRVNRPNTACYKTTSNLQDMVFFVKRNGFVIEKLHLPPALDQAPTVKVAPRNMCSSRPGTSMLEF